MNRCRPEKHNFPCIKPYLLTSLLRHFAIENNEKNNYFSNRALSDADFDLQFTYTTRCRQTKSRFPKIKQYLLTPGGFFLDFAPLRSSSLRLGLPRVPSGALLASKSWFYFRKTSTCLETYCFAYIEPMFWPPELPCGGFWGA